MPEFTEKELLNFLRQLVHDRVTIALERIPSSFQSTQEFTEFVQAAESLLEEMIATRQQIQNQ